MRRDIKSLWWSLGGWLQHITHITFLYGASDGHREGTHG